MSAASRTRVLYLDVACLIFGYLQILAAIALTVTAIWVACVESGCRYPIFSTISPRLPIRTLFVNIVWVFAALLVTGIHKRKEGYVLSYFVFGIVAAVGLVIEGTLLAAFKVHAPTACTIFLLIAVYVLCLSMVYAVYCNIKLEKGSKQKPFTVLHEDCVDGIKLEEAV